MKTIGQIGQFPWASVSPPRRFSVLVVSLALNAGCGTDAAPASEAGSGGQGGEAPSPGLSNTVPDPGSNPEPTPDELSPGGAGPVPAGTGGDGAGPVPIGGGAGGTTSSAGAEANPVAPSDGGAGAEPIGGAGNVAGSGGAVAGGGGTGNPTAGAAGAAAGGSGVGGSGVVGEATFDIGVELASDLDPDAPTTVGIVTWSVDVAVDAAHIEFGLDESYGMTAPVDLTAADFRTLLLGMKTETTYHFRVVASAGATSYESEDQTLTTGEAPTFAPIASFSVMNPDALTRGFYITSFWRNGTTDTPFIFDSDGDLVWWYLVPQNQSGISQARLSADGQSIWCTNETLQGAPLQRVSIDGLEMQTYSDVVASHGITAVSGETMAFLEYGESDCDSIVEIDNAGNTTEVFESTNVTGTPGSLMSCHGNAVRYSMTEDVYTFSDHRQTVAVVDREGSLVWSLAELVQGGKAAWGGSQHGHQLLADSIVIYANDGAGSGQSQAIEYALDGTLINAFASAGNATNFGDVQRLANGNTVITYSTSSLIQVVDPNDELVAEITGTGSFGYLEFRETLYGLPDDIQQ